MNEEEIRSKIRTGTTVLAQAAREMLEPKPSIHINGWTKFDAAIRGLRMSEFSIFCGPTGAGKTQFLAALSAKLLMQGVPQFIMSVETGGPDYIIRMLSAMSGVDYNSGEPISKEEVKRALDETGGAFYKNNLWLSTYDSRIPPAELFDTVRYAANTLKAKFIVMDNVNYFTEVTCSKDQIVAIDSTIHTLVEIAKQVDSHIVMVMHPRKTEDRRIVSEFDIKGSSTAVQEASNVFLFNRQADEPNSTYREILFAKLRKNGRAQGRVVLFNSPDGVSYHEAKFAEDYHDR